MVVIPTSVYKEELSLSDAKKPADPLRDTPAAVEPVEQAAQPITPLFDREELKKMSPIEKQQAVLRSQSKAPLPKIDLPPRVGPIGHAKGVTLQLSPDVEIVPEPAPVQFTVDGVPFTVDTGEVTTQDYMDRTIDREVRSGYLNSVVAEELSNNGQDLDVALKLDLPPSHPDDVSDIKTLQENGMLDPESDKGKLWLYGSRFIYDHFRKKFAATRTRKARAGGAQGPLFKREDLEGMTPIEKQLAAVNVQTRDYGPAMIQATTDIGKEGLTDEQIMQAGLDFIGMVEHNLFFGGATLAETEEMSSDTRRALAGLLHMYQEDLPPFSWSGTVRLFKGMFLDPTNYMGSLAGLQFVKQLLAGGAKTFGKHQLRDRLFKKLWGSTFIGVEGSAYAAMQDAYLQHLKGGGDPNFEFNKVQNFTAATTGLVAGTALGGVLSNLPAIGKGLVAAAKAVGRAAEPGLARSVVGVPLPIPKAAPSPIQPAPVFYSAVARAVDALPMEKGNAVQMRAMIAKTEGVKAEEMAWIGLDEFLKGNKKVTKQEIRDFVAANRVQIEEVVRADEGVTQEIGYLRRRYEMMVEGSGDYADLPPSLREERAEKMLADIDAMEASNVVGRPKYDEPALNLPGGENYREVLLTLPQKATTPPPKSLDALPEGYEVIFDQTSPVGQQFGVVPPGQAHARPMSGRAASPEEAKAQALEYMNMTRKRDWDDELAYGGYTGGHFDEPNVLAHIRLNDRTGPNGEKILFVEEIQSDWHQAGRKKGYVDRDKPWEVFDVRDAENVIVAKYATEAEAKAHTQGTNYLDYDKFKIIDGIPDAPLKKTWHEMSFRRVARMAAEEGYDAIAWTPGKIQAERYDLSKHMDTVRVEKLRDGTKAGQYYVTGTKDGRGVGLEKVVPENELSELIGKDLAEKAIKDAPQYPDGRDYSGVDLEIGGEGMKGFYDKMLKKYAEKFGKKFDAKVKKIGINTDDEFSSTPMARVLDDNMTDVAKQLAESRGLVWDDLPSQQRLRLADEGLALSDSELDALGVPSRSPRIDSGEEVWTLPVTKKMRDSVLKKGVPMFGIGAGGATAIGMDNEAQANQP